MSWRIVVITGIAKLDLKMGFLVVRKESTTRIHLGEIHTLMIASTAVSLTAALMNALIKKKIKVVFCDEKSTPTAELMPYRPSHDTSLKIKMQIGWDEDLRKAIWTEIVSEKIRQQQKVLLITKHDEEADKLSTYLTEITFGDETNREGHAAKVYFNALFGMDFTRSAESVTNAALNYGYSILLSAFNREVNLNGYLTQLGLFHDNRFNPYNLSSDLMEPFRPYVDLWVFRSNYQVLEQAEKAELIDLLNQDVMIAEKTQKLHYAIRIYTKSVFDAMNNRDPALIQFYHYEL